MKKINLIVPIIIFLALSGLAQAESMGERLSGRILLQVEAHGEAWYVSPDNSMRYFLGRPADAFSLMREFGLGIKHEELANYLNSGFPSRLGGKIMLDVEAKGEAYYVYPPDLAGYYLGRPADAFALMRGLGLGITDVDLETIMARTPNYILAQIEERIFGLVNDERKENGLSGLGRNSELAAVAREHSNNLARENQAFTDMEKSCDFPLIHHEGFDFGLYNKNRLNTRDIYYFSRAGENIALMSGAEVKMRYQSFSQGQAEIRACEDNRSSLEAEFSSRLDEIEDDLEKKLVVEEEITKRTEAFNKEHEVQVVEIKWDEQGILAAKTVEGWMNSQGHKEIILGEDYNEAGVGATFVNGYLITTQIFIKRSDCGFLSGPCCQKQGYYPYCFTPLTCRHDKCE